MPPLDASRFVRRVGELVRSPGVLAHWQERCRESHAEEQQRGKQLDGWNRRRDDLFPWDVCFPAPTPGASPASKRSAERLPWDYCCQDECRVPITLTVMPATVLVLDMHRIVSPDRRQRAIVAGLVPRELHSGNEPYAGGPLPLSNSHRLSRADAYLILALAHDRGRRDAKQIDPFGAGVTVGAVFWEIMGRHVEDLDSSDEVTLDDCLAEVEHDLRDAGLLSSGPPPLAEVPNPTRSGLKATVADRHEEVEDRPAPKTAGGSEALVELVS
jgi:hypothetical protein